MCELFLPLNDNTLYDIGIYSGNKNIFYLRLAASLTSSALIRFDVDILNKM